MRPSHAHATHGRSALPRPRQIRLSDPRRAGALCLLWRVGAAATAVAEPGRAPASAEDRVGPAATVGEPAGAVRPRCAVRQPARRRDAARARQAVLPAGQRDDRVGYRACPQPSLARPRAAASGLRACDCQLSDAVLPRALRPLRTNHQTVRPDAVSGDLRRPARLRAARRPPVGHRLGGFARDVRFGRAAGARLRAGGREPDARVHVVRGQSGRRQQPAVRAGTAAGLACRHDRSGPDGRRRVAARGPADQTGRSPARAGPGRGARRPDADAPDRPAPRRDGRCPGRGRRARRRARVLSVVATPVPGRRTVT